MPEAHSSLIVPPAEARRFIIDCLLATKVPEKNAVALAELLVTADTMGHFNYGMNRLTTHIVSLQNQTVNGAAMPEIIKETPCTAWVDGRNGLGAVVGNFCMDLAIKKCKQVGVGWVCAKRSNYFDMPGWYAMRAMKQGFVGLTMTNTPALVVPTRSKVAALGTNPLAVAIPAKSDQFLLDMTTSTVSLGKIEMQKRKGEALPKGWALDANGQATDSPDVALEAERLIPLGGSDKTSGYKGYGLGAAVDVLTGVMSGANYLTKMPKWRDSHPDIESDYGHVFISVDPNCFAPCFEQRVAHFNSVVRKAEPVSYIILSLFIYSNQISHLD